MLALLSGVAFLSLKKNRFSGCLGYPVSDLFAFFKMLDNPDLIASLIGFDGLLAIALTAVATRLLSDGNRAVKLENAKDTVLEKVSKVEATVEYVYGRLEGLTGILADGRVTPGEVATMTNEVASIRDKIAGIVDQGGDRT